MDRQRYRSDEARQFCTSAYHIDEATQRLCHPAGEEAWKNHVAHALKFMTEDKLHVEPAKNDGVHYKPDHARIHAYLADHPSDPEDDLPLNPYAEFIAATKDMPGETEAQRLTIERIGQDIFRKTLIRMWNRCCSVTGIDHPSLLRASHIKAWASCDDSEERQNVDNGLLLAAHIDAAFDVGLISFSDLGVILFSPELSIENIKRLGIDREITIPMSPGRKRYMQWHRQNTYRDTERIRANAFKAIRLPLIDLFEWCRTAMPITSFP
jgi:hypothetical protein